MAGIIASCIAAHPPRMSIEAKAPPFQRGLIAGEKEMGRVLRAMKPDLFVVQSAHWISTFNWFATCQDPHQGVCVADEAPDLMPGTPYKRKGDPAFARALVEALKADGVAALPNDSPHFTWDYASLVPLLYIDPDAEVPVVHLPTCLMADAAECRRVGQKIDAVAKTLGRNVVFIASNALSHAIVRGPEKMPTPERVALDKRMIQLLEAGDVATIRDWMPTFAREAVAEMGGRVMNTLLGCLEAQAERGPLRGRQYGEYGQSSGSGNAAVAVTAA